MEGEASTDSRKSNGNLGSWYNFNYYFNYTVVWSCAVTALSMYSVNWSSQNDVSIHPSLLITNTGSPYSFLVNHGLCKSFLGTVVTLWVAEHTYYCKVYYLHLTALGHSVCSFPLCHPVLPSLWCSQGHIMIIHFSFPMWHRTWRICLSAPGSRRISSSSFHLAENGRTPFLGEN